MTAVQVEQAWGAPRAVNSDLRSDGRTDQWVYRREGSDAYVYLTGGRVTSVSTHTERKYVRPGWSKGRVLAGLGPPDRKQYAGGEAWIYLPAAKDVQTATTITFECDRAFDVKRDVVR